MFKKTIKSFLFRIKIPFITFFIIKYMSRNNIYTEKSYISNNLLDILKKNKGYVKFAISGTGVLILFYDEYIIKVPLGKVSNESLEKNWINYTKIKNTTLKGIIDYKLEKIDVLYKMDKLNIVETSQHDVNFILNMFNFNKKEFTVKHFIDNKIINIGLLKEKCNVTLKLSMDMLIVSNVMHGDLTKDNIMKNKKGNIVVIDLDRYTLNGISSIDQIHYHVDKISKDKKISYFKYLELMILDIKHYEYEIFDLFLYFLYRISSENRDNIILNKSYYNQICKLHKLFVEHNVYNKNKPVE